jgi:hypothetical protein
MNSLEEIESYRILTNLEPKDFYLTVSENSQLGGGQGV